MNTRVHRPAGSPAGFLRLGRRKPKVAAATRRRAYALTFTGRMVAAAALVSLPCGWLLGGPFAVLAASLILSLLVALLATRRRLNALAIDDPKALRATVGEPIALSLTLFHRGGPPLCALILRSLGSNGGVRSAGYVERLEKGEQVRTKIALRLTRRGKLSSLPLELATSYPLGLVEARRPLLLRSDFLGLPRVGRCSQLDVRSLGRALRLLRPRLQDRLEEETSGVRPLRPGEPARRIHWRASARRDELILRQFEGRRIAPLRIILSLIEGQSAPWQSQRASFEAAVSMAATLCTEGLRQGRQVGLSCVGREVKPKAALSKLRSGRSGLLTHLVVLACVDAEPLGESYGSVPSDALERVSARAHQVGEEVLVVVPGDGIAQVAVHRSDRSAGRIHARRARAGSGHA